MAPSKSKEKKDGKTNRRKTASNSKNSTANTVSDGQAPADLAEQLSKAKNRGQMYDLVKGHAAGSIPEFLKYLPENIRLPIPIRDLRRFKVGEDEEYCPGQYIRMEGAEYLMIQAPVKKNYHQIWKAVQQDRIRLLVCLCHDEQISNSDDSKCYPYFPTEPEQTMEVEQKKGTFTIVCKSREGLSMGATKYELEFTDSEVVVEKNSDDPNAVNEKTRRIHLFHMNTWTGLKPETGNALELSQNVALFFREIKKHEIGILRKSMENFVAPVLLQSFDGINRSAIGWVALMLLRDVEKRECFDVPNLMKSIMKWRLGSISTYYQFSFCMAVCLHIGKEVKCCEEKKQDEFRSKVEERKQKRLELQKKFKKERQERRREKDRIKMAEGKGRKYERILMEVKNKRNEEYQVKEMKKRTENQGKKWEKQQKNFEEFKDLTDQTLQKKDEKVDDDEVKEGKISEEKEGKFV
uniref:Tyrosine-protein phosphatase domain-containing protein n=1 Tax=Caenorhabditis tropicalis TaxID=1561998 RepID=A0A1I7U3G7_9PELO